MRETRNVKQRSRGAKMVQGAGLAIGLVLYLALQDYSEIDYFRDTDDHLRVAWLTWNLNQGHFPPAAFFPRDGGLGGLVVHWTIPWNAILIALVAAPAAFVGWFEAFRLSAPLIGPALLGAVGAAAAWSVAPLVRRQGRIVAAAVAVSGPVVLGYGMPGGLDHHLAGITLALLAGGAAVRALRADTRRWAGLCGAFFAMAVWTAVDALPMAVVIAGALLIVEKGTGRRWLSTVAAAAAVVVSAVAVALDPPEAGRWAIDAYRFSIFHASVWIVMLAAAGAPEVLRGRVPPLVATATIGGAAAIFWALLLRSGITDAVVIDFPVEILSRIAEMRPADTVDRALRVFLPLVPAGVGAAWFGLQARTRVERCSWAVAAVGVVVLAGLAVWHVRFGAHAQASAAAVLGVAYVRAQVVARALRRKPQRSRWATVAGAAPSIAVALVAAAHVVPMVPTWPPPVAAEQPVEERGDCVLSRVAGDLDAVLRPDTVVLTDTNRAPRLLTLTHLRSFAGPYHGYRRKTPARLLDILGSRDDASVREAFAQEGIGAVLVCPPAMKAMPRVAEGTFGWSLATGQPAQWLAPVNLPTPGTALRVYRFVE